MPDGPSVRMTGRGAAIVVGLVVAGAALLGVAETTGAETVGTVPNLLWLAALLGVGIAAWLTQFEVVESDR